MSNAPPAHAPSSELREFERWVQIDPEIRAGEPVVRGTRVSVQVLADLAAQGAEADELLEDYPRLTPESLAAALAYARAHPRIARATRPSWTNGRLIGRGGSAGR